MTDGYGIPIKNNDIIKGAKSLTVGYVVDTLYDDLIATLPETAFKSSLVNGGDDGSSEFTINVPNIGKGINKLIVSWESMIGILFNDTIVPSINTQWSTAWSRMYYSTEPHTFVVIRPQDNKSDLGMFNVKYAYSDDRLIVLAHYHFRDGVVANEFKVLCDFQSSDDITYGYDINLYYQSFGNNLNPYTWVKLVEKNGDIKVVDYNRYPLEFNNGANTLTHYILGENKNLEYNNNIRFDLLKNDLNYNPIESFTFGSINKTEYYESYKNVKFYENHNYFDNQPNISFGKVSDIDKTDWKIYNENWIADLNKDSNIKPYVNIKGFIEGKQSDYVNETKFVYNSFNNIFKTIKSFSYDFEMPIDSKDISIIVDGRRRYIDINKPMLKGYISGKVNTSGCSGQSFKIRCYRHSNIDFIGEYDVDVSGNYFIPNLNYLDEYDIMLVDSNSVIETKVSSKRKPILNDEINELKLGVHTSTLNTDLLILFDFSVLKFSFNKTASPWVQDDTILTPKPYEMYYNLTTSYPSHINWWEYGKKYYMSSNAHIMDVRYVDNNNVINSLLNSNAEFEITVTFNHFGHSYNQWNALFACSDSTNQGNFLYINNDRIYFGAYDKVKNITYSTEYLNISRNTVYTTIIKRKGNLVTLTVADAVTLNNKLETTLELPSDFVWDFSKIKLGCAWGSSQFWGDFVDFEFRIL